MKNSIVLFTIMAVIISCGGSSSGGGNSSNPDRNPLKPQGPLSLISESKAKTLLEDNIETLKEIQLGHTFLKHESCRNIYSGEVVSGKYISKYTVIDFDEFEITYKVQVIEYPKGEHCLSFSKLQHKNYILKEYIDLNNDFQFTLDLLDNPTFGLANNTVVVKGQFSPDDNTTNAEFIKNDIEFGINYKKSFYVSYYSEVALKFYVTYLGQRYLIETNHSEFTKEQEVVDVNSVDSSGLETFYSDPNEYDDEN